MTREATLEQFHADVLATIQLHRPSLQPALITPSTDLRTLGLTDSLGIMLLMQTIEVSLGVEVPFGAGEERNFETIAHMYDAYVSPSAADER